MAKKTLPLSEKNIRNPKWPIGKEESPLYLYDGDGLFIIISPPIFLPDPKTGEPKSVAGSKLWRFKYRFNNKERLISFGAYPEVSLEQAREKRRIAREQVAAGVDPGVEKKKYKNATAGISAAEDENYSFEKVARDWHKITKKGWSVDYGNQILERLKKEAFPHIGKSQIADIEAPHILKMLRKIVERGAIEAAHRMHFDCRRIFAYAIGCGYVKRNPAADLNRSLPPYRKGNRAAIIDPKGVSKLLNAIDGYKGSHVVRAALKLAPLFFCRPGELRALEWSWIDFGEKIIDIPKENMKGRKGEKRAHFIPLCRQALNILKDLKIITGNGKFVFPSVRGPSRSMSENTVNVALRAMGFSEDEMCGHGFRALARTVARERLKIPEAYLEIQLSHVTKSPNGTAYDRVAFLDERIEMMQVWADYLDSLRVGGPIPAHNLTFKG